MKGGLNNQNSLLVFQISKQSQFVFPVAMRNVVTITLIYNLIFLGVSSDCLHPDSGHGAYLQKSRKGHCVLNMASAGKLGHI